MIRLFKPWILIIPLFCMASIRSEAQKKSKITHLTEAEFKLKVHNFDANKQWKFLGNKPAIIDFYADWCAPCRKLSPLLSKIAEKRSDIVIYKINVDEQEALAKYFKVTNIPMLLYIPLTGKPYTSIGLPTEGEIEELIRTKLKK